MKTSGASSSRDRGLDPGLKETLAHVARFYDACKYGCQGCEGYRKSTDLRKLAGCLQELVRRGQLKRSETVFWDLGCADGRVNVLLSYFVRKSIGVEIDPEILSEAEPRLRALRAELVAAGLIPPPANLAWFAGSSLDGDLQEKVRAVAGVGFADVDLFYTYITLHDAFAGEIAGKGKRGAGYLLYGFSRVLPSYPGLELLVPDLGGQGIAALYARGP